MAKSKIEYEWIQDCYGRYCLKVTRKKGKLSWSEVVEKLHDSGDFAGRHFVLEVHISEELPMDLYDEGDIWLLYEIDDYLGKDWVTRLTPQKLNMVSKSSRGKMSGMCPICYKEISMTTEKINFCSSCGQEIDWAVEVDE